MALRVQRDLFVADQGDGGVGGGGAGSRRGGLFHPLGMHAGGREKQAHHQQEKEGQIFCHDHNLTTSGINSRGYL